MDGVATQDEYRLLETRPRVLAKFFEQSRDNWKRKCQEANAEVKRFRDKVRDVQQSRQTWREQAEQSQQEQQRAAGLFLPVATFARTWEPTLWRVRLRVS